MKQFACIIGFFLGLLHLCVAVTVTADFSTSSTIPVTTSSYTATGNDVQLSLGFVPLRATNLTVVKNTGLPFISGQFSNLAHGQVVDLWHGGKSYRFVANYYGGSGNDLVLEWAYRNLAAWGKNGYGQLGNNSNTNSGDAVLVTNTGVLSGKTVVAVSAGGLHNLALCSDGTIAAWGYNLSGALGNGSTAMSSVPVIVNQSGVLSGKTVVAVSAGEYHSLALCSDGTVAAWGSNGSGQLGNGNTTMSSVPVQVTQSGVLAGKTVVSVKAGIAHNLALCSDGTLVSWGSNSNGQLGNNSATDSSVPVLVSRIGVLSDKTVVAVSAGGHSLALCSDGTVAAWGSNGFGQLGNDSNIDSSVPVPVNNISFSALIFKTVVAISAGLNHSLVLCSDGTMAAWGYNGDGVLGTASNTSRQRPATVIISKQAAIIYGSNKVDAISAGDYHNVALSSYGYVLRWGLQSDQSVLNAGGGGWASGVLMNTNNVMTVSAGGAHGLALFGYFGSEDPFSNVATLAGLTLESGSLSPAFNSTSTSYTTSVANSTTSITVRPTLTTTAATVLVNGTLVYSGRDSQNIPLTVGDNTITVVVTAGDGTTTLTYTITVTRLSLLANFATPSSIPFTAASYTATGNVVQLSLGFTPPTGTNLTVVKNTGLPFISGQFSNLGHGQVVDLSYGGKSYRFVANYYGGSGNDLVLEWAYRDLAAWGSNSFGELGNGSTTSKSVPILVNQNGVLTGKTVVAVSAGYRHNFALCSDGTIAAWGSNGSGQLGNGNTTNSSVPVLVTQSGVLSGKTVVAVSARSSHSLALCSDGTVAAWGSNGSGQLGNGNTTNSSVPVLVTQSGVLSGKTVVAVSAGWAHHVALCSDGTLAAWGDNYYGQLGNNSTTDSSVPVLVSQSGVLSGKTVVAVSAGEYHSLALCSDGTVAAWGYNDSGRLGNNSTTNSRVPVLVSRSGVLSGKTVVAVSAAGGHSFALCSDGIMAAWGRNVEGQLGNGSNGSNNRSIVPALVTQSGVLSGKTVVAVSAGSSHSLALCSDGTIAAWGNNQAGKLGNNNSTTSSSVPVLVTQSGVLSGKTLVAVSAGSGHSLALSSYDESTAGLSDFTLSSGSYNPIFDTATTAYSADVSYTTSSITILPTALVENLSVLKVNGSIVASGSNSQPIPLVVGANVITCVVTAPDGITTKTYTVMVNRAPSAGSSLSALTLSSGTLTPNFSSNTTSYTASVTNATSSITVMPTLTTTTATVRVNGTPVTSGSNSQSIPLSVGANTITVVGTAQDGTTTSTYTVTVTRAPLTVSTLSALTLSNGSLSPGFVSSTTTYTASVANATSSITVRPTLTTTTATVRVNGTLVTSGSNSQSIPLSVGANTITVVGIAQDGTTTSTYTVTVVREVSGYASWQDDVFTSEEQANPSMSDEQASPAGDGISNLMKYAMKLDPKSSGVANLPRSSARDGHLTLTFRRNKLASDLTYTVQVTSDLTSAEWQDAGVVISQTDEGEFWMVTVRDDEPMHNHSKRFMRLKVSK